MFEIGDYVIYGSYGICKVNDITSLDIPGSSKDRIYYVLIPLNEKGGRVYSPTDAANVHIRKIVNKEEAYALIEKIPTIEAAWVVNDKAREMIYKQAVQSEDLIELVKIIKTMYNRKQQRISMGKKSTVIDERYFKLAEDKLYQELSFVMDCDREQIKEMIRKKAEQAEEVLP